MWETSLNPLSPNINIQILQTDLHTFPLRISWENLITDQGILFGDHLLIPITVALDNYWILLGENWCWSLLGLKGLSEQLPWPNSQDKINTKEIVPFPRSVVGTSHYLS